MKACDKKRVQGYFIKMSLHFTKNDTIFYKKCHSGEPKFYFCLKYHIQLKFF